MGSMNWGKVQTGLEGLIEGDLRSLLHMALNLIPVEAERDELLQVAKLMRGVNESQ
jgi:hypothetical protein